jgi:outer membrane protein TolC
MIVLASATALSAGCVSNHARHGYDDVLRESRGDFTAARDATSATSRASARARAIDERALGEEVRLDTVLRLALARSPEIAEGRARVRALAERIPAAERLPDPELLIQQEGTPLARPYALDEAEQIMFGVRQTFPAPGSLSAHSRAALADARVEAANQRTRAFDLATRVRRAYFEYHRAWNEYRAHLEHVEIADRLLAVARGRYDAGQGGQEDVLRLLVQLSRLHGDLASAEQEVSSGRALLNVLMAREPDAPLGPPATHEPTDVSLDLAGLDRALERRRPELGAATRALERGEAAVDAARRTRDWPSFMVGLDYMLMPMAHETHGYAAMFSINLPWLNPAHDERVREAEHTLEADRMARDAAQRTARYELRAAVARHEAARRAFTLLDRDVVPQARRSYEAARDAFAVGRRDTLTVLDALRAYVEVRIERVRAIGRMETSLAEVERAAGTTLAEADDRAKGGAP